MAVDPYVCIIFVSNRLMSSFSTIVLEVKTQAQDQPHVNPDNQPVNMKSKLEASMTHVDNRGSNNFDDSDDDIPTLDDVSYIDMVKCFKYNPKSDRWSPRSNNIEQIVQIFPYN